MVSPITYTEAAGCNDPSPTIVVYHHLCEYNDDLVEHLGVATRPETFRAHLAYYKRHYDLISQADLLKHRLPRRPLLITFDDLYRSVLDVAGPMLRDANAPSLLFLNSSAVLTRTVPFDNLLSLAFQVLGGARVLALLGGDGGVKTVAGIISKTVSHLGLARVRAARKEIVRALGTTEADLWAKTRLFMVAQDVVKLADYGIDTGNHTMNHAFFRSLSPVELVAEIAGAKVALEGMTGQPIRCVSVPYGNEADATPAALEVARASGHEAIFLVHGRSNRWRPAPDIFFRTSPREVSVQILPLILGGLPNLRGVVGRLRPASAPAPASSGLLGVERRDLQMRALAKTVVIIVGYRNPEDIVDCLAALGGLDGRSAFEVVIAENGGEAGFEGALQKMLSASFLRFVDAGNGEATELAFEHRTYRFLLRQAGSPPAIVHLTAMPDNLGYAGAINACIRLIEYRPGWDAVWILNPDTKPMAGALWELASHAAHHGRGMVGSRMCTEEQSMHLRSCGLKWSKVRGRTECIGLDMSLREVEADARFYEQGLDSPSGASMYVTRSLMQHLGMMDERYFLYFEDLDWGLRAKAIGAVGYAHGSIVQHQGGSTIGSARRQSCASYLATYLEFRNRILFVRKFHPSWLAWTVVAQIGHTANLLVSGAFSTLPAAISGLLAGIRGEMGRPDRIMTRHKQPVREPAHLR